MARQKLVRNTKPARRALSRQQRKAALGRFTRRTMALVFGYVAAGRSTRNLIRSVRALKDDIDAWGDRWGRKDIRATAAMVKHRGNGEWTCKNCEWIMVSRGRICFLIGCDPEAKNCSYICTELPKDPDYPVS